MAAEIVVPITRIRDRTPVLPLPRYMTPGSAGMDLAADIPQEILLQPLQRTLIPTGFALAIPDGYEAQIRPRSGLALRYGLSILNTPGTIDADYRDKREWYDPVAVMKDRMSGLNAPVIEAEVDSLLQDAISQAQAAPFPSLKALHENVYA